MAANEDYAVVVGINDYKTPPYAGLKGAKQDATEFVKWLKSPKGGGLPADNVDPFTKLSDPKGRVPNFSDVCALLQKLRKRAPEDKVRIGRRLYIFMAGHGVSPKGGLDEAGLVTIEADGDHAPYLGGKVHADQIFDAGRFDEVLLFMDCCRTTSLLIDQMPTFFFEKPDPGAAARGRRFYALATAKGQVARETKQGGKMRGVFSRVLIEGLNGGAKPDAQGRLTTRHLQSYLEERLAKIVISGEVQMPKFPASEEIVLRQGLAQKLTRVNVTFAKPAHDVKVEDGATLAPVTPTNVERVPKGLRFQLPPGKTYVLRAVNAAGKVLRTDVVAIRTEEADVTL